MTVDFVAGKKPTADEFDALPKGIVARGNRTSAKTGITTEAGVLRLDDIPLTSGRAYKLIITNFGVDGAAATDVGLIRIRYTTDGSTPSTSSTQLSAIRLTVDNATEYPIQPFIADYYPGSDVTFSALMTAQATAGTIAIQPDSAGVTLLIEDLGLDPGDTGTDI